MIESETELLRRIAGPEPDRSRALGELFQQAQPALRQLTLRITSRADLAEDAVQETFAAVLRSIGRFRGEAKLSTWMYRIAVREALKASRRANRSEITGNSGDQMSGPGREPAQALADREGALRLLRAIGELPADLRVVLGLAASGDLPQAEIAGVLGLPVGTVHSRLHTARERLRRRLGLPATP